jgi:small subunit ribosomal protein S6
MSLYENVFIARQDISGAQVEALADTFTQLIAEQGGEVKKREYWGLRNLAYRMKKHRKGHYVLFNIDGPPAAIAELERTMRINEDVLRYLTLRVEALEEGPSSVMQNRGSREDRPRRSDRYGEGRERFGEPRDGGDRPPREGGERPPERPAAEAPAPSVPSEGGERAPERPPERPAAEAPAPSVPSEGGERPPERPAAEAPAPSVPSETVEA